MSEFGAVQFIALFAWLILAGSAVASYRLGWKEGVRIGLIWGSITKGAGSTVLRVIEDEGWGWYSTKEADVRNGDYLLSSDYHPRR